MQNDLILKGSVSANLRIRHGKIDISCLGGRRNNLYQNCEKRGGGGQFLLLTVLNIPFYCQFQKFVLKAMNLKNYDRMERDAV